MFGSFFEQIARCVFPFQSFTFSRLNVPSLAFASLAVLFRGENFFENFLRRNAKLGLEVFVAEFGRRKNEVAESAVLIKPKRKENYF